jgi:hypothetical protein
MHDIIHGHDHDHDHDHDTYIAETGYDIRDQDNMPFDGNSHELTKM